MLRKRIDTLAKAQELRDPIRRFAGESQSRIEQDLLMLQRGIGSKEILRRWAIYKKLVKLRKARKAQRLWPAQEAELQALQQAARDAIAEARIARADELMQQVRDFGRYPKASKHVASRERRLAQNLREARKEKQLSPEQESELKVLQQAEMDSSNGEETEERRHLPEETNNGRKSTTPLQRKKEHNAAYYQKNKARIVAKSTAYNQKHRAERKEYDAKRRATPHRMAKQKGYNAVYYQKNKAKVREYQRMYRATPHFKAKRKEYERMYRATPEVKAKQKEALRRYRASPHGKARRKEDNAAYYQKNKARIAAKQKENQRKDRATPQGKARDVPGHPAGQSRPEDEAGRGASDWCNASTQTW